VTATILAIDPGRDGAIACARGREVLAAVLLADLHGGARWDVAHPLVTAALASIVAEHQPGLAVLELVSARPGEGRSSILTAGVGFGVLLGILSALRVPTITPTPAAWARVVLAGIPGEGKARAISVAMQHYPALDLSPGRRRVPHPGLADAACLALHGARHVQRAR
jgi:crossover junction endodeoxyribonuclease RuvC